MKFKKSEDAAVVPLARLSKAHSMFKRKQKSDRDLLSAALNRKNELPKGLTKRTSTTTLISSSTGSTEEFSGPSGGDAKGEISPCRLSLLVNIEPTCSSVASVIHTYQQVNIMTSISSSIMTRRLDREVAKLPSVDQAAFNKGGSGLQHAPEYSQSAYKSMLAREVRIGNYDTLLPS